MIVDRRCVIETCRKKFTAEHPDQWTCSAECSALLEELKEESSKVELTIGAEIEAIGESEASKARRALAGLAIGNQVDQIGREGKALYSEPPNALESADVAFRLSEVALKLHELARNAEKRVRAYSEGEEKGVYPRAFSMAADRLVSMCLSRIEAAIGGSDEPDPVYPPDDLSPDVEPDGEEEEVARDEGEGEDPSGHEEDGLRADSGDVQGDVGDRPSRRRRDARRSARRVDP